MKKVALGLTLLFVLFAFAQASADVIWDGEYFQFRFAVQPNGGIIYDGGQYFGPNSQDIQVFTNAGAVCGCFEDIAQGSLSELGGTMVMNAMAKGPDGGINPENGLLVEGYAEVILDGFQTNYGVDVDQQSQAWITRRFSVDESGDYFVSANFSGEADFNAFGEPVLRHHALYSFSGTVILEEYEDGFSPTWLREVARFTFDNTTGSDDVSVELSNRTGVFYQLKVLLEVNTDLQNLYLFTVQGPMVGPYEVGSAENPFQLSATVTSTQYDLNVTTAGSGTVDLDPAGGVYDEGEAVTLTATPDVGWEFSGWSGDLTGSVNPATITMDADKSVTATFTEIPDQYNLTVTTVGSGTVDPAVGTYPEDTVVTLTATPDAGWEFSGWSGDLAGSVNPATITMDADKTVTATFTEAGPQYSLTVTTEGSGAVDPAGGTYPEGTVVTLTATPDDGWEFSGWSGDLAGSVNPATITMDGDKAVTATFTQLSQYDLTVTTEGSGTVVLDPDGGTYPEGTVVTLTATPDEGWALDEWSGNVMGSQNPAVIVMDGDKTVTATFTEVMEGQFTLSVMAVGSGIVMVAPAQGAYDPDTQVTLTAEAAEGWHFSGWSGDLSGSENPATITMDSNKEVTATFMFQYTLDVATVGSGAVTLDPEGGVYDEGTVVTLTAIPDEDWAFSEWSDDLMGSQNPVVIVMDGDKTVTATFTEVMGGQFTLSVTTEGSGIVMLEPPAGVYDDGTDVILEAIPDSGWQFSEWSGDLSGTDNPATITMNADKVVAAIFTELQKTKRHHSDCFIGTAASGQSPGGYLGVLMLIGASMLALGIGTCVRKGLLASRMEE